MNNSYYNLAIYKFSSFVGEIVPMNCNENSLLSQTQPNFIKNQPNLKPTSWGKPTDPYATPTQVQPICLNN